MPSNRRPGRSSRPDKQGNALRGIESKAAVWIADHRAALSALNIKTVSVYVKPGTPELITAEVSGGPADESERYADEFERYADQLVFELTPRDTAGLRDATGQRAYTFAV